MIKLFCSLLLIVSGSLHANHSKLRNIKWEKHSNKDGITVFRPTNFSHKSGVIPLKFIATIDFEVAKVLTVLADNTRKKEWLPNVVEISEIERKGKANRTVYYHYDFPWPFSDRDFIIKTVGVYDTKTKMISVDLRSTEHPKAPKKKGNVRGLTYDGYSLIKPLSANQTRIEMAFISDFGGMMPTFIINAVQSKWPYNFMKRLSRQLSKQDIKADPIFEPNNQ